MSTLGHKLKHELQSLIPPTLFFFVAFHLIAFTRAMMLEEYGIRVSTFMAATVGALIVAKVVLLADLFPFINRFPDRPLIYNVLWKTGVYFVAAFGVHYLEHLVHFMRKHENFAAANRHLLDEVVWPHFWVVQMWLLVLLLVYCALRELVRALGRDKVRQMFFGSPRSAPGLT